ncbi:hypothetical protein [Pseudomonas fragi]|uniref:hypothetical protein n=1 Tax=Pseudomonas fragi TaxID=296 RepID=UPI002953E69A|nr:hypothetical protein [Pseudomonas fragi]WOL30529.1 hypothetical protein Q1A94_24815 [Pseudomonas fragi]
MRTNFLIGAIAITLAGCGDVTPEQREAIACGPTMAYVMSQTFVKRGLKAPSTADFGSYSESQVTPMPAGESACKFLVIGHVDAQNSFGAMIRNRYIVTVAKTKGLDSWTASEMTIR